MKISNNLFTYNFARPKINNISNPLISNTLRGDIVSFSAKKYDAETIINPTNHCAYCGCKVYTEAQLESIAKEMLSSKADRLQGKIKSMLEKLEEAKQSQELSLAKRLENENQISFFKNFLEIASKKSFLKGSQIFEQVYSKNADEAFEILLKNLHPLLKTIDHVSPQNEDKENNNSDVNLVEACYCCNHDLKKGSPFNEFYTMYPSIKNNMPPEKFEYAISSLLDSSQTNVIQRLSATNLVKFLDRLFIQRTEAKNYLDSVDFRIKGCVQGIADAINGCKDEIAAKEIEMKQCQDKLDSMKQDPEYMALLKKLELNNKLEDIKSALSLYRDKRQKLSNSLNELRNKKPSSKSKKQDDMSPEEKEAKIQSLKSNIDGLNNIIAAKEEQQLDIELQIEELDTKFPTVEMLQHRKNKLSYILSCYVNLEQARNTLVEKEGLLASLLEQGENIQQQILQLPEKDFDISSFSPDDAQLFNEYKNLVEARNFINDHPNGNVVKNLINQYAYSRIETDIAELELQPVIIAYNQDILRKQLSSQLQSLTKQTQDVTNQINCLSKNISNLKKETREMSKQDAENEIALISEKMKLLNEKQNYIKLPQKILSIQAEIHLLTSTIDDLERKLNSINSVTDSNT